MTTQKTIDLTTHYLGLTLNSPLVVSANPLSEKLTHIRQMEDAGAGAVVLFSLFQEQLVATQLELHRTLTHGTESYAEALSYFPESARYHTGPEGYLELIQRAKQAVKIPIIASLNATSAGEWAHYAKLIEQAGADALELNIYSIPTGLEKSGEQVEQDLLDVVRAVKADVHIPIAVKLSPFFSNMAHMAHKLDGLGANGLVLFNRFYQPDMDLETLEVYPHVLLSTSHEIRLPMRWIAILYGRIKADLAATSGIHHAQDVIKMLMAGANVTMMASALLSHGISYLHTIENDMVHWLEDHEYESIAQLRGSMSQVNCADPSAFERAQYMRALTTYME